MTPFLPRVATLATAAIVAASILASPDPLRAQSAIAGLLPDSISGVTGQTYDVALRVDLGTTGKLLATYSVTIVWDSTIIRLDSLRAGEFGTPLVNYASGNEVRFAQLSGSASGAFSLARLHYRFVNDTVGKRAPITVSFTDLVATDFTDLRIGLQTGSAVSRVLPPTVIVTFTPDSIRERVGFKPRIDLTADFSQATGVLLGSYVAGIVWDPAIMVLDSLTAGDYEAPEMNQLGPGELRIAAADAQGRGGAPFSLAKLYFRFVNQSFPTETPLTLSVTELVAATTFANLLPGVLARNGKALIGGVLRGDIDVNGAVAALDAQLILQGVVALALPAGVAGLPNGDADCGGSLQARDAQIVLHQVVGNPITQFCVARIQ